MTGYTVLGGALIFFFLFIYASWVGASIKVESQKGDNPKRRITEIFP